MSASATGEAQQHWRHGIKAVLPANAATLNQDPAVKSVSCASVGNCSAVGYYVDTSGQYQGLLLTETAGRWGSGVEAALPANASLVHQQVDLFSVACVSPGECVGVGGYVDASGDFQPLVLTQTAGTWAPGAEVAAPADAQQAGLFSVSCVSAGNCSAVGNYLDGSHNIWGLVLTETAGTWGSAVQASLPADAAATNQAANVNSVSCAPSGQCAAVGFYTDQLGNEQAMWLTETAGTWTGAVEVDLPANGAATSQQAFLVSVSCPSSGNCGAVGSYTDTSGDLRPLLVSETAGSWGEGVEAGLPANGEAVSEAYLDSVSCASAGNCAAVGSYGGPPSTFEGLLVDETGGVWSGGVEARLPTDAEPPVLQLAHIASVSCSSAGNCSAAGFYTNGYDVRGTLFLSERAGRWARGIAGIPPAGALDGGAVYSISCPSALRCSAVGNYGAAFGAHGLLFDSTPTLPCIVPKVKRKRLSAARHSIRSHHCSAGKIRHAPSRAIRKGHVISQTPKPGRHLKPGGKVNLKVSTGAQRGSMRRSRQ